MFGLTQQVGGDPCRIASAVCQNQNFAGACDHVDTDFAEDFPLGRGNVDVARADDLIHGRDAFGAVGQSRDSLCAAGLENFRHACGGRGGENNRIYFAVLACRGRHDDLRHACDLGRDDIHQDGGRIGRRAARHIDTGLFNGGVFLTQHDAGLVVHHKIFVDLLAVEGFDVCRRLTQGLEEVFVHPGKGLVDLRLRDLQIVDFRAVKFQSILFQCFVAVCADVCNDAVHHVLDILLSTDVTVQNFFGFQVFKLIESNHFASSCSFNAPRSFSSISSIS